MMQKRVLLINPPTGLMIREDRCQASVNNNPLVMRPPIDLMYVAASLEAHGFECRLRDYPLLRKSWKDFDSELREFNPDVLVMSTTISTLVNDLHAASMAKNYNPDILTIAKGPHFKVEDQRALRDFPDLDVAVHGESEIPISECCTKNGLSEVRGITYRDRSTGNILRTERPPLLDDLDALPLPARHLIDNSLYVRPDTLEPQTTIQTARGCPWSCIYCLSPVVYGSQVRQRSPESLVAEVEHCKTRYGIQNFIFLADTFTVNKKWVISLCKLLIERNLKVSWACNSRVNTLDEERIQWMKKAGCWLIAFGTESGNDEHLKLMKKGTTTEFAKPAIDLCRKYGIKSYTYFIFGLPWETKDSARKTIQFAKWLDADIAEFYTAYPLPGTELAKMAEEMGLYEKSALRESHLGAYEPAILRTPELSPQDILRYSTQARMEFYMRPKYIIRKLTGIRSYNELKAHLTFGYQLLRGVFTVRRRAAMST